MFIFQSYTSLPDGTHVLVSQSFTLTGGDVMLWLWQVGLFRIRLDSFADPWAFAAAAAVIGCPMVIMSILSMAIPGTDWLEVPTIYKAYVRAYVREYPPKIWQYMVQYLHFRILKFPLIMRW